MTHSKADNKLSDNPMDRRKLLANMMIVTDGVVAAGTVSACTSSGNGATSASTTPQTDSSKNARPNSPAEALAALKAGNERFATGNSEHPNQGIELRESFASSQAPWASVLGCADSRVAPELIFDQGISDLFVCRVAGNVDNPATVASMAYSVAVLSVGMFVVLGHSDCGAVKAAIDVANGEMEAGEFAVLTDLIEPAVTKVNPSLATGEPLTKTIKENAKVQSDGLPAASTIISDAVKADKLLIVPSCI
jgi:carbonic anhydrase